MLNELRGIPNPDKVRFVTLIDKIVNCTIQITCLDSNSLDPLPVAILQELNDLSLSIEALCEKLKCSSTVGRRVILEALFILEKVNYVKREDNNLWSQNLSSFDKPGLQVSKQLVELGFQYLPFSKQLAPHLPFMFYKKLKTHLEQEKITYWEPFYDETLYSNENLKKGIKESCDKYYAYPNNTVTYDYDTTDIRYETLQRSGFKQTGLSYLLTSNVKWIGNTFSVPYIAHRCFLYPLEKNVWRARILRFQHGIVVDSYTEEINRRIEKDSCFLEQLLYKSININNLLH